jgi:hypothetical protein
MRFMMLLPAPVEALEKCAVPDRGIVTAMRKYDEEMNKAGVLLSEEGLHPTSKGVRIKVSGGKRIELQTMIVFADADAVRPAHIVEFYGLLGGGQKDAGLDGSARPADQLAILPGLTHYNISASPLLPMVVAPFLDVQSAAKAK